MIDYDPRIVALYDGDNPPDADHTFVMRMAERVGAERILDLGCGTGALTVALATGDREVVGIDPSAAMIAFARDRDGSERVRWIRGDHHQIPNMAFDLVIMTGNVAQHIPDSAGSDTLTSVARVLGQGGQLVFDSRNPMARAWESWSDDTRTFRDTPWGALVEWNELESNVDGVVTMQFHNLFVQTQDSVVRRESFAFRSLDRLREQLTDAGLIVAATYGDWLSRPFRSDSKTMVIVAARS